MAAKASAGAWLRTGGASHDLNSCIVFTLERGPKTL